MIKPDPISLTVHHLHIGFNDEVLAHGTGFVYQKMQGYYLITNWHNVSGRHPKTHRLLSRHGGVPNVICTYFRSKENPGNSFREMIPLYADEEMQQPLWIEHPVHKSKVDVVAISLPETFTAKYAMYPVNGIKFESEFKEEIADEAFIVGYPFAKSQYIELPIWKRASIASEPDVNIDQLPMMHIDTATRPGLSGSPVIMQRVGIHGMTDGVVTPDTSIGRIRNFIGVYSGRIGTNELKAQLGIVWKARAIEEILG